MIRKFLHLTSRTVATFDDKDVVRGKVTGTARYPNGNEDQITLDVAYVTSDSRFLEVVDDDPQVS